MSDCAAQALRLPLTSRDGAALRWLEARCAEWIVYIRRRRKRLTRGPLSAEELEILNALTEAENAVRRLRAALTQETSPWRT